MDDHKYVSSVVTAITEHFKNRKLNVFLNQKSEDRIPMLEIIPGNGDFETIQSDLKALGIRSIRNKKDVTVKFKEENLKIKIDELWEKIRSDIWKEEVSINKVHQDPSQSPEQTFEEEETPEPVSENKKEDRVINVPVREVRFNVRSREKKTSKAQTLEKLLTRFEKVKLQRERTDEIVENLEAGVSTVGSSVQREIFFQLMEMGLNREEIYDLMLTYEMKASGSIARILDVFSCVLDRKGYAVTKKDDFIEIKPGEEIKLKTVSVEELMGLIDEVCREITWEKTPRRF